MISVQFSQPVEDVFAEQMASLYVVSRPATNKLLLTSGWVQFGEEKMQHNLMFEFVNCKRILHLLTAIGSFLMDIILK